MNLFPTTLARSTLATAAVLTLGVASVHAHPGHGLHEAGALHVLSSPYHLAMLALGGAVLLFAGRFVERRWPRRALQGAGLIALGFAPVLWGLRI